MVMATIDACYLSPHKQRQETDSPLISEVRKLRHGEIKECARGPHG